MDELKVSIITPCFNSRDTIRRTIESVLNQNYKNIEYIIIDGSSKDGTVEIIKEYEKYGVKYISEDDDGVYDAMNKGIGMATGTLIGIINSDDWYELDAVKKIVDHYDNNKYEVIYGFTTFWDNKEITKIALFFHNALDSQMIAHPSCFVTKAVYDDIGLYDLKYRSSADYDLFLNIKHNHPEVVFSPIEEKIANFSFGGISGTDVGAMETAKICYKYGIITRKKMILYLIILRLHMFKKR